MTASVIHSNQFKTTQWSGGFTTELFIYPPISSYKDRDFDFRLSTATVDVEESTFTPLPNISRKLMILEGEMTLIHTGHFSDHLKKFDVGAFEGGWETTSKGSCTDFNLMTRGVTQGELTGQTIEQGEVIDFVLPTTANWVALYVSRGKIKAHSNEVSKGDLLILQSPNIRSLQIIAEEQSDVVVVSVN